MPPSGPCNVPAVAMAPWELFIAGAGDEIPVIREGGAQGRVNGMCLVQGTGQGCAADGAGIVRAQTRPEPSPINCLINCSSPGSQALTQGCCSVIAMGTQSSSQGGIILPECLPKCSSQKGSVLIPLGVC